MLSNVALSHQGRFGETTAIVDRCIFESAAKIIWLCTNPDQEKFTRYLADGLKTELEFKQKIESNITQRKGTVFAIESRMLTSIANHIAASELSDSEIAKAKRLPDLASILSSIGLDRTIYIAAQRIGSHHIHGTWASLLFHYLEKDSGAGDAGFVPSGNDSSTHINQFLFVSIFVLKAMTAYLRYALEDAERQAFESLFKSTEQEIVRVYTEAVGGDLSA
jgi:Family of unknown function (DUF5677)